MFKMLKVIYYTHLYVIKLVPNNRHGAERKKVIFVQPPMILEYLLHDINSIKIIDNFSTIYLTYTNPTQTGLNICQ